MGGGSVNRTRSERPAPDALARLVPRRFARRVGVASRAARCDEQQTRSRPRHVASSCCAAAWIVERHLGCIGSEARTSIVVFVDAMH
jgi:hypothetical protein